MKRISIICPVYNSAGFLPTLIDSILKQSFKNFECFFIDDASNDDSLAILENITDPRFSIIMNKENLGAQKSREKGFKKATGDYVVFIDSDDYINHRYLEKLAEKLEAEQTDIVLCNYEIINHNNKRIRVNTDVTPVDKTDFPLDSEKEKKIILSKPAFWNKMYRHAFLKQYISFPNVNVAQDLAIVPLLLAHAKVSYVDEILYSYRIIEESISNTYDDRLLEIHTSFSYLLSLKEQFYDELEFMAIGHYYYQISKALYIEDKELRMRIFNTLKIKLGCEFPHYLKNAYFKKRLDYRLFVFLLRRKVIYKNTFIHWLVISVIKIPFLNKWVRKSDR